jgi:CheY-like chemotaxis protein
MQGNPFNNGSTDNQMRIRIYVELFLYQIDSSIKDYSYLLACHLRYQDSNSSFEGETEMKILIVDDSQDLAFTLQMMLATEGFEVMSANDGREGYLAYLDFKPDLVITDIQMPGETGLELVGQIRLLNPMVRTIYMSGNLGSFLSPLEEERKTHPVSLLAKPFSRGQLLSTVSAMAA